MESGGLLLTFVPNKTRKQKQGKLKPACQPKLKLNEKDGKRAAPLAREVGYNSKQEFVAHLDFYHL